MSLLSFEVIVSRYVAVPFTFDIKTTNLGLDVTQHQIPSLHLHDHLLGPQSTFRLQPLQFGHTVAQ